LVRIISPLNRPTIIIIPYQLRPVFTELLDIYIKAHPSIGGNHAGLFWGGGILVAVFLGQLVVLVSHVGGNFCAEVVLIVLGDELLLLVVERGGLLVLEIMGMI
jgi:hypothetical protein